MRTIYQSIVQNIGSDAAVFIEERMIVLFGEEAPAELVDFCYIINKVPLEDEITVGDILVLDGIEYKITAVGSEVCRNLSNLAHISISFKGLTKAELAGTLYVEEKKIINLKEGSVIKIKKNDI
mgnify:CR=1 FL=1